MRIAIAALCLAFCSGPVLAEDLSSKKQPNDSAHSDGRTMAPDTKGQAQPQGNTGPITTGTGGAPAASPQGETPPNMQAAPEGSTKTVVDPKK